MPMRRPAMNLVVLFSSFEQSMPRLSSMDIEAEEKELYEMEGGPNIKLPIEKTALHRKASILS